MSYLEHMVSVLASNSTDGLFTTEQAGNEIGRYLDTRQFISAEWTIRLLDQADFVVRRPALCVWAYRPVTVFGRVFRRLA